MNLSTFLPDIYLEAPGCPESVALNALRHAMREFCERTRAWQEDLDDISVISGQPSYDIDVPVDAELVMVLSGRYDGSQFDKIYTPEEMDRVLVTWRSDTGTGVDYLIQDWNTLYVSPIPTADDSEPVSLRAALKPTLSATTCGDILDQWREGLSSGAIARLKMITGKPWSDPQGAVYHASQFETAKRRARVLVLNGFGERATAVVPQKY
jgi:hypothetical protein